MVKDYQRLLRGVTYATNKTEAVRALAEIVVDKSGRAFVLGLDLKAAELCVETLDYGITKCNLETAERGAFFITLRRLVERHEILPDRVVIKEGIEMLDGSVPPDGFGDVRCGKYKGGLVAVKTERVAGWHRYQKIRGRFYREVILWETLSHPNILKLVGVQEDIGKQQVVTVSEWMTHGNIMDYIEHNSANRLELLHGVSQGLRYLHHANLIHGNLKGASILVSNDTPPHACLADFSFITAVYEPDGISCSIAVGIESISFVAPELLSGCEKPTPQADVYAVGVAIIEVLTGQHLFHGDTYMVFLHNLLRGQFPDKPKDASAIGLSDPLWNLVQRCWNRDTKSRPGVGELVTHLGKAAANWDGLMPPGALAQNVQEGWEGEIQRCTTPPRLAQSPPEETQEVDTEPLGGKPYPVSPPPVQSLSKGSRDAFCIAEVHPPLQHRGVSPSTFPKEKRGGFKHIKSKVHGLFASS